MNVTAHDEFALVRSAVAGNREAFQQLAKQQVQSTLACAYTLCRDRHEAEDLTQETLVEAWRCLDRFDGRCRFSTWLFGILRHRFLKSRRRRTATPVPVEEIPANNIPPRDPAPSVVAEDSEDADRIRDAVSQLPEEHRLVLELRFFAGAKLDDIAAALDCPLGTVKSRLHHGLEKLRKMELSMNLFHVDRESTQRQS